MSLEESIQKLQQSVDELTIQISDVTRWFVDKQVNEVRSEPTKKTKKKKEAIETNPVHVPESSVDESESEPEISPTIDTTATEVINEEPTPEPLKVKEVSKQEQPIPEHITHEDFAALARQFINQEQGNADRVKDIIRSFGVDKLSQLSDSEVREAYRKVQKVMA